MTANICGARRLFSLVDELIPLGALEVAKDVCFFNFMKMDIYVFGN